MTDWIVHSEERVHAFGEMVIGRVSVSFGDVNGKDRG